MDVMRREPLDFVQFSYNIEDREAEAGVTATGSVIGGIATMINRPYQRGSLFGKSQGAAAAQSSPTELGCSSWGQFFLKFILGHRAVTCIIPATAKPRPHGRQHAGEFRARTRCNAQRVQKC